ncbi:hypothetical protein PG993_013613 [Apiospora rasikravindrae]|uniref:DUF7726 domain-containing protein n=1 Tax=Apiospora rasikravindrae TaxID=990691 RepID=A0ABR1RY50_9PEZI
MIREAVKEGTHLHVPTRSSIAVERAKDAHYTTVTAIGRKRRASSASLQDAIDSYKQNLSHIDTSEIYIDLHFSNASVNIFLKMRGPFQGATSKAFIQAWDSFKQRKLAGLKLPDPNKRRQTEAARAVLATAAAQTEPRTLVQVPASAQRRVHFGAPPSIPDISSIHLPGEDTDEVPVYDTCTVIREEIDAHLLAYEGLTQVQVCRDIYAHGLKSPTRCKGIQPKQLSDFRHKQGSNAGATRSVFCAAYVYFEKIRLAQGAPKSAHRLEMESRWGPEGFDRDRDDRTP